MPLIPLHRLIRGTENSIDFLLNIFRGLGRLLSQGLDLMGHHGKPLACIPGPRRFNGGIQGQQVGLFGNFRNGLGDLANLLSGSPQGIDFFSGSLSLFSPPRG